MRRRRSGASLVRVALLVALALAVRPGWAGAEEAGPLDVYVAPWCGYCRALEGDLRTRHIPFFRYDIEADAAARRRYEALGGEGLPLTKVGREVVRGYDMPAILRLLGRDR